VSNNTFVNSINNCTKTTTKSWRVAT